MAYKKRDRRFESICEVAAFRAGIALRTAQALLPDATPRQMKRIANKILQWTDGKDRTPKITQAALQELVMQNCQCIARECPALFFWEPMSRQINAYFAEED
jgi:hypothetical protein